VHRLSTYGGSGYSSAALPTLSAGPVRRASSFKDGGWILIAILASAAMACDVSDEGLGAVEVNGDGSARPTDSRTERPGVSGPSIDPLPADAAPGQRPDAGPDRGPGPRDGGPVDSAAPADAPRVDAAAPPPDGPPTPPPPPPDTAPPQPQVLLLVGTAALSAGDMALSTRLNTLGFRVQAKEVVNDQQTAEARTMAPGFALVVMSASLPQGSGLPAQLRSLAVPILCNKPVFADNLGIGRPGMSAVATAEQSVQIRAPEHPMAAGRRGLVIVVDQRRPFGLVEVVPAAVIVATIAEEPTEAVIFGLEKGAADRFGMAPARRVGFFGQETTFLSLNEAGAAMFDAAVRWAVGKL
jgi:hypothetical protein